MTSLEYATWRARVAPHPVCIAALNELPTEAEEPVDGEPLCDSDREKLIPWTLPPRKLSAIIKAVAKSFDIKPEHILGPKRYVRYVRARQVAMYLARRLTRYSLPQLGRQFNRDHSTVHHNIEAVKRGILVDAELAASVRAIEGRLA